MRIGVIGDVHLAWDDRDVELLDAAGYDLLLFVGDLAGYGPKGGLRVARSMARLRTRALAIPGNHDAATVAQFASEVFGAHPLARSMLGIGMRQRVAQLARALGPVTLCGYDVHDFAVHDLIVLAARPHSFGGPRLAFRRYLTQRFGVHSMQDSEAKLCALFDEIPRAKRIVVLAHAGPHGLGAARDAIYGCDFRPEAGDWGDPDLAQALTHAQRTGKHVLAVVAGHMHQRLRGGGVRCWHVEHDGVQHVNAARVPRRRRNDAGTEHHHVLLTVRDDHVSVEEVWLEYSRSRSRRSRL